MKGVLRGVSFEGISPEDFFGQFHRLLTDSGREWYVDDVELNELPFRAGRYTGAELERALNEQPALSFARIRRYPAGAQAGRIEEYGDYAQSGCDLLILYYDGGFWDVYAKDEGLIHELYGFCRDRELCGGELIDETDCRARMYF